MLVRVQPSQLLGRLTAGSSALNRRMRGSNPARGALLRTRPWRPGGLQPRAGEGSIPSVRASRPGLLVDRGCRPLKPATRVRIPLGALTTRPWCQRQHAGVPCLRCGFEPRRPLQRIVCFIDITCGALVLTGTRAACTREFGVRLPGAPPLLAVAQRSRAPPCDGGRRRFESSRRDLVATTGERGTAPV